MSRKVVSFETIAGLIRAQMTLTPECQGCSCGPVKWRRADGTGCNWILSRLEGSQGLECLERLVPLLGSLRDGFNVPEPRSHMVISPSTHRARAIKPVAPEGNSRAVEQVDELLEGAKTAVRESRSILSYHSRTLPRTRQQCRDAEAAIARSLNVLGPDRPASEWSARTGAPTT